MWNRLHTLLSVKGVDSEFYSRKFNCRALCSSTNPNFHRELEIPEINRIIFYSQPKSKIMESLLSLPTPYLCSPAIPSSGLSFALYVIGLNS